VAASAQARSFLPPLDLLSPRLPSRQDGFTHLTADPAALLGVANQFYAESHDAWLCIALDGAALGAEVKLEPAAPVGDRPPGDAQRKGGGGPGAPPLLFPHLYGPIPTAAAVREHRVERDGGGVYVGIEGLA